jgi:hypothetical protein
VCECLNVLLFEGARFIELGCELQHLSCTFHCRLVLKNFKHAVVDVLFQNLFELCGILGCWF